MSFPVLRQEVKSAKAAEKVTRNPIRVDEQVEDGYFESMKIAKVRGQIRLVLAFLRSWSRT